jgi:hypothetical protein
LRFAANDRIKDRPAFCVDRGVRAYLVCGKLDGQFLSGLPTDDPRGLGTVDEYVRGSPDSKPIRNEIASLGIEVMNGRARLHDGRSVAGVRIIRVLPHDVGAAAGLRSQNVAIPQLLTAGLVVGSLFFPPAILLGVFLVQQSGIGESYDL